MNKKKKRIIYDIVKYLKGKYTDNSAGHGWLHFERVWKMAKRLSRGQKLDTFVAEVSALLHDVDDYKFKKEGEDDLANTKKILNKYNLDSEILGKIYDIASHVSYKGGKADDRQKTLEGKIVQDADRLDVIGAVGIARVFAYGGNKNRPIYDLKIKPRDMVSFDEYKIASPSINHFYEKILLLKDRLNTLQAKKIAENRHKFVEEFLNQFWDEIKGNE
ncbi:HD domain-containing protein [Patescibacteria group bacterium]